MQRLNPLTETITPVSVTKYSRDNWQIVVCSETGMVYLQNPPEYSQLIDEFAWEKQFSEERARRKAKEPVISFISDVIKRLRHKLREKEKIESVSEAVLGQILSTAESKAGLTLVDVGCGSGSKLLKIVSSMRKKSPAAFKAIGVEISEVQAKEAHGNLQKIAGYCIHDSAIEGLKQISDDSVDFIILCSFLEHEVNPLPLLRVCKDKLTRQGKIVIKVPNFASLNRLVRQEKWCGFRYPDHVNYFVPKTLRLIVERAGMKVDTLDALPISDNMWAIVSK